MATMNLRRSGVSKETRSSGERRAEILSPDLGDVEQISVDSVDLVRPVLTAENLSNQISSIKALFTEPSDSSYQILSIVVVQWWFNTPLNSPVRRSITGCLNQLKNDSLKSLIVEQISNRLRQDCADSDPERLVEVVKNIHRCMENFQCGEAGVEREMETIVVFLRDALQEKVEGICEEDVSPVEKVLFTDQAQEIIRVLVSVAKDRLQTLNEELRTSLNTFVEKVIHHGSLPLDLRSNAGIIYVAGLDIAELRSKLLAPEDSPEDEGCGARLSLAHGVLSCCSLDSLAARADEGSLLQVLLDQYLRIAGSVQTTSTVLGYSRGLLGWSNRLLEASRAGLVGELGRLEAALEFTWSHLEHHIESVRHNTKEFLSNLIQCCEVPSLGGGPLLTSFMSQTLALPLHKKARFSSLSCLVKAGVLLQILEINPHFRTEILRLGEEYALVGPITDLYDNIIKADFKGCETVDDWYRSTVKPLVSQLKESQTLGSSQLSRNLLHRCGKLVPGLADLILKEEQGLQGKLALYALKLGRELGNPWDIMKHRGLVERSLRSMDEEERMQALALIVESHSSVQSFHNVELNLVREFVERSLCLPSAAGRQVLLANLKKMLARLRDGALACLKKLSSERLKKEHNQLVEQLTSGSGFVSGLTRLMFRNLFVGANFSRRGTVLEILTQIHQVFSLTSPPAWLNLAQVLTEEACRSLYCCLYDSFENNKEKALSLLKDIPPHFLGLTNPDKVRTILDEVVTLMSSSKPSSCLTAGFIIKLLLTAPAAAWVLADKLGLVHADSRKVKFYAAVFVRNKVAEQLHLAETDLLTAAAEQPIYGALHVLRSVYSELQDNETDSGWKELTKDVISLGYSVWRVVAPVVASDSPEGHLPMDNDVVAVKQLQKMMDRSLGSKVAKRGVRQGTAREKDFSIHCAVLDKVAVSDVYPDEIVEDLIDDILGLTTGEQRNSEEPKVKVEDGMKLMSKQDSEEGEDTADINPPLTEYGVVKAKEVSSQLLLLCAWRSVKELSLLLGDLCARESLLNSNQVLEIASFLMDLLSQTKHRGAFEQAYVAFSKLCECLWRSSKQELHTHPTLLLQELLDNIAGKKRYTGASKTGLCATRRSAGVPFIVQAIVSSEPDPSSPVFKDAMKRLIALAGDRGVEGEYRVHACNILRALFRDTRLGESVSGFVESGMKVSINGFEASNWAERNSATLLFSALITRIFGVKREKDSSELSSKNFLTGKVFFQRYPSLHSFLLSKLEDSSPSSTESGTLQLYPALYPILLILSRIFPSPSESLNNPFKLSSFLSLVEKCSSSPVLAVRKLAAAALVPLIPPDQLVEYGEAQLARLKNRKLSTNLTHGLLLQLVQIKRAEAHLPSSTPRLATCSLELASLLVNECACTTVSAQYMVLVNMEENILQDVGEYLESLLRDKLFLGGEESRVETALSVPSDLWKPLYYKECTVFLSNWSIRSQDPGLMLKLFLHPEVEVRLTAIQIYKKFLELGDEGKIDKSDIVNLILCEKQDLCLSLLLDICWLFPSSAFQHTDLAFFLSLLQVKQSEEVLCSTVRLSAKILSSLSTDTDGSENRTEHKQEKEEHRLSESRLRLADTLRRFSSTEQSCALRFSVIQALQENTSLLSFNPGTSVEDRISFVLLWACLIDLIYDEEETIRDACIQINKQLTGDEVSSELAGQSVLVQCCRRVGLVWPAAVVFLLLGNILTLLLDKDEGIETDTDRAFDKGEMNTYRELHTTCTTFLNKLSSFLNQLSPKLRDKCFCEQLPEKLLMMLLPHLPGGVIVYSLNQLLEYFKAHNTWNERETKVLSDIEKSMQSAEIVNPA